MAIRGERSDLRFSAFLLGALLIAGPIAAASSWEATGALDVGRTGQTTTVLPSGRVLVVGGEISIATIPEVEIWNPATGTWSPGASLHTGRTDHTATLLPSGRVLVAGGRFGDLPLTSVELYDPVTDLWCSSNDMACPAGWDGAAPPPGALAWPHAEHTATLLPSGKVLVVGGAGECGPPNPLCPEVPARAELYDPATGVWSSRRECSTGADDDGNAPCPMALSRKRHTATLLPSGKVLVVAGRTTEGRSASVELYDSATGKWTRRETCDAGAGDDAEAPCPLTDPREFHTATLLPTTGKVLVAGGRGALSDIASTELYDPATGKWSQRVSCGAGAIDDPDNPCPLEEARQKHSATVLPNGDLLVAGGDGLAGDLDSAERYDPETGLWATVSATMEFARRSHGAALLSTGRVLVVAGETFGTGELASTELFEPGDGGFLPTGDLAVARWDHSASLLPSGKVLVAGGSGSPLDASVELFDGAAWHSRPCGASPLNDLERPCPLANGRANHTATVLPINGNVLVVGGIPGGFADPFASVELYDRTTGKWDHRVTCLPGESDEERPCPLNVSRANHSVTLLPTGSVLAAGGLGIDTTLSSSELYDPSSGQWSLTGELSVPRSSHSETLLHTGEVLVAGGTRFLGDVRSAELYDPTTGTWSSTGSMAEARRSHTATLLPSGKVLVVGGLAEGTVLGSAEIYDPVTGTWAATGSLPSGQERANHTATLLPSGRVLVTGGWDGGTAYRSSAELFDPATGAWTTIASLAIERGLHSATVLASGEVLVAGGRRFTGSSTVAVGSTEVLDPLGLSAVRGRPDITGSNQPFAYGTALEIDGSGLGGDSEAGGGNRSSTAIHLPQLRFLNLESERLVTVRSDTLPVFCDPVGANPSFCAETASLSVSDFPPSFDPGFHLMTVVSSGVPSASEIVRFDCSVAIGDQPQPALDVADGDSATFEVGTQGARTFQWQQCLLGEACDCDDASPPASCAGAPSPPGAWVDVFGATERVFTRNPVEGQESGRRFRVRVDAGCTPNGSAVSDAALLTIFDDQAPAADVLTPDGGEFWLLSVPDALNSETVSWSMSDNVRICGARAALLFSNDGGASYAAVDGLPLLEEDQGANCPFPGASATSLVYDIPETPPSGSPGSLYKIEVTVTDHKGLATTVRSDNPFFIVGPDPSLETLILWNKTRMRAQAIADGFDPAAIDEDLEELASQLRDLAVAEGGLVFDLGIVTELGDLYAEWDKCAPGGEDHPCDTPGTPTEEAKRANRVLFECAPDEPAAQTIAPCPEPAGDPPTRSGIHDKLLELVAIHPAIRNVVLVGGDGIIPMARLSDQTSTPEQCYPTGATGCPHDTGDTGQFSNEVSGLSSGGTTVGRALASGKYLSDSLLAVEERILPELGDYPTTTLVVEDASAPDRFDRFIPDLMLGRLVESPAEIAATIVRYLGRNGNLDLTDAFAERTVVSAYDFLSDAGLEIFRSWSGSEDADFATDLAHCRSAAGVAGLASSIDCLIGDDWVAGDGEVDALRAKITPAGARLGIGSLSGHATHHQLGVPGGNNFTIKGLDTTDGPDPPGPDPPPAGIETLDLAGSVVYGVGCHGGLPVPDQPLAAEAKPRDLPQAFLKSGAQAYIANTGYGWGLESVIGYGERLTQILTEELSAPRTGTVVVGEAFRETKRRYFAEAARMDAYDRKSFLQWTYYGLPMYSVTTGITSLGEQPEEPSSPFLGTPPSLADYPEQQQLGSVVVRRRGRQGRVGGDPSVGPTPEFLTRLELQFDLTADGVYRKFDAEGNVVDPASLCPAPPLECSISEDSCTVDEDCTAFPGETCRPVGGCYYTLNGIAERSTGMADLPVEPYLIFDSRLSGTSQHGVLWLGGEYEEEENWAALVAELASNGGNFDDNGSTPQAMRARMVTRRSAEGPDATDCRPQDAEINSLVAPTGEALKSTPGSDQYDLHRLGRTLDMEILYYNNTSAARRAENCDRAGPLLAPGPHHTVDGARINWSVQVDDAPLGAGDQGAGVWRVVVVYNDGSVETGAGGEKTGRWQPLELEPPGTPDGNGTWTGSLLATTLPAGREHDFAYVLQAVDLRGNVTWSVFETTTLPASGEPHATAAVTPVPLDLAAAGLAVQIVDSPDPVAAGGVLTYSILVTNLGDEAVPNVDVLTILPAGLGLLGAVGIGWNCAQSALGATCSRAALEPGAAPPIGVIVFAPPAGGVIVASVAVTAGAVDQDQQPSSDDSASTLVLPSGPPMAHAGEDREVNVGDSILLGDIPAASGGSVPYSYDWTVTPIGTTLSALDVANPVLTGVAEGVYTASLEITDGAGVTSDPDSAEISVICPLLLDLYNMTIDGAKVFSSSDRIVAELVEIRSGQVTFRARNEIVLKEDFSVREDAQFIAELDSAATCTP